MLTVLSPHSPDLLRGDGRHGRARRKHPPDYRAKSSLLVLPGAEHSFRPAAGQQFVNSRGVDAEEVLRTEASILGSDDLHRQVIREIGLERMYPQLLEKPSPLQKWLKDIKTYVETTLGIADPVKGNGRLIR